MRIWLLSIGVFFCLQVGATGPDLPAYYGPGFYQGYQSGKLKNQDMIFALHKILAKDHHALGYDRARYYLFGKLYLEQITGIWGVKDVYCERTFTNKELKIGPGLVPDANVLNVEHTWPQSRFTTRFPKELQKSDLHHLFPTDTQMNAYRAALRFGEVVEDLEILKCPIAKLGRNAHGDLIFEVPDRQKGNTARAIFYFAIRYQMKISPDEESTLRRWHEQDPVDEQEVVRNEEIFRLQGDRNPFIDFSDLLTRIDQF